jgi:hypothetical protein
MFTGIHRSKYLNAIDNLVDTETGFLMFGNHSLVFYLILFKAIMLNSCSLLKQLFAYHRTKLNMHDDSNDIFNSYSLSPSPISSTVNSVCDFIGSSSK